MSPRGYFIVDQNGGFESRRELIYEETGAILCLESLVHEMCCTFESHGRFLNAVLKEPKKCILGVFLEGFDGVYVDWTCFATESSSTVYKLFTSVEGSSFESSRKGVKLPCNSKGELCEGIVEIISHLVRQVYGVRKDPLSGLASKVNLNISEVCIRKVVENIFHTHVTGV